jgi:hypothetical protein
LNIGYALGSLKRRLIPLHRPTEKGAISSSL